MALGLDSVDVDAGAMTSSQADVAAPPTDEQLHGKACIVCGATTAPFVPAGHRHTPTGARTAPLGWAVVACSDHVPKESR